jgi:hypothetical protein
MNGIVRVETCGCRENSSIGALMLMELSRWKAVGRGRIGLSFLRESGSLAVGYGSDGIEGISLATAESHAGCMERVRGVL